MRYFSIIVLLSLLPNTLFAINLQQTNRSNSLTFEKLEDSRTKNGHVTNDYDFIFTLGGSYVDSPLIVKDPGNSNQLDEIIPSMTGLHFGLGYYIRPWLMIGGTGTYNWFEDNQGNNHSGFSDPQLRLKLRLINKERWALSVIPFLNINTDQGKFTTSGLSSPRLNGIEMSPISDLGMSFGGKISGEYVFDWAQLVANVGYRESDKAFDVDSGGTTQIDYTKTLLTGMGVYVPVSHGWGINGEYLRRWSFPLFNGDQEQNEFFIGAAGALTKSVHAFAGVGFGNLFADNDGNDYRVSAGLKYVGNLFAPKRKKLKAIYVPKDIEDVEHLAVVNSSCRSPYVFGTVNHVVVRFANNVGYIDRENQNLKRIASYIKTRQSDIKAIYIDGHTSVSGSAEYNLKLSKLRALQIKKFLTKEGVSPSKMSPRGFGESRLVNKADLGGSTPASAENRRVEFKVELHPSNEYCK